MFAGLLAVVYLTALRPARVALATHVAAPAFEAIETEGSDRYIVEPSPRGGADVYVVPVDAETDDERQAGTAVWASPLGALFVVPAMFLVAVFPDRPYWLYLMGYHLVVGVVASLVFAVGLSVFEPAFALYTFSRTYLTETVSLVVPLLLWLAGRDVPQADSAVTEASRIGGSDAADGIK